MEIPEQPENGEEVDEPFESIYYRVHADIVKNPKRVSRKGGKVTKHKCLKEDGNN
jgi:hypothetical protein